MTQESTGNLSRGSRDVSVARLRLTELVQQSDAELASVSPGEIRNLCQDLLAQLDGLRSEVGELRKREVASQALYERYVDLFNLAPVGYAVLDGRGYVSEANLTLARMLGVVPSRLTEQGLTDFVAPESREAYRLHREAISATGLPRLGLLVLRRVDGTRITVQIDAQPVTGPDGHLAWCRMSFSDVTERNATLEALRHSELRLRRVHEVAKLGYWDWYPSANALDWSEGVYAIFGRDPEGFVPTVDAVDAMIHQEDRNRHTADRSQMLLWDGPVVRSYRIVWPDGTVHHVQQATEIVRGEHGEVDRVSGTVQDVTDHKQAEMALRETNERLASAVADLESTQEQLVVQERLAAVGQLSAGIAHDFNNVLASIQLYSQISQRTEGLDPILRERLVVISEEARRGAALVQQVLDFGRRAVIEPKPVELADFLQGAAELLRRTLPESIRIDTEVGAEDTMVSVDPTRLQQALINLALNSRDAMPEGGLLRLRVARTPPNTQVSCMPCGREFTGEWVVLSISDTGAGIDPQDLPQIFEPFFTTRRPSGHGLGLSQVLGIIEQQDGHITVDTAVGQGTTFSLYFPALAQLAVEEEGWQDREVAYGSDQAILVVEDNDAMRKALVDVLNMLGYRTHAAPDGQEALARLLEGGDEIALVLSDWIMPVMGGEALVAAMRERGLSVPVLMITGDPLTSEVAAKPPGVVAWVQKPVSLECLSAAISFALG